MTCPTERRKDPWWIWPGSLYMYIYIYLEPKWPLLCLEFRPRFEGFDGLTFKNRGAQMIAVEVWQRRGGRGGEGGGGGEEGQLTQNLTTPHLTGGEKKLLETCKKGLLIDSAVFRPTSPYLLGHSFLGYLFRPRWDHIPEYPLRIPRQMVKKTYIFFVHCWHRWDAFGVSVARDKSTKRESGFAWHHSWIKSDGLSSCWMDRKIVEKI